MREVIASTVPDLWSNIDGFTNQNAASELIWRGQDDSKWPLETTLERFFKQQGITTPQYATDEVKSAVLVQQQVYEFESIIAFHHILRHLVSSSVPRDLLGVLDDKFPITDIMVVMRHHTCPSRLMDWTRSPYVAMYFALAGISENGGALFGLNLTEYCKNVQKAYESLYKHASPKGSNLPEMFINHTDFWAAVKKTDWDMPVPLYSKVTLGRNFAQQSIFLIDMNLESPTIQAIDKAFEEKKDQLFLKIIIPRDLREELDRELYRMNIDGFHLFEELTGAAFYSKPFLRGLKPFGYTMK